MIETPGNCGEECECGEIRIFYDNPRYPTWSEDPYLCRRVPFGYVAASRTAQLAEVYEALSTSGVDVSFEGGYIRIVSLTDQNLQRRTPSRIGIQFPVRQLGELGWSFIVGDVAGRGSKAPECPTTSCCDECDGDLSSARLDASAVHLRESARNLELSAIDPEQELLEDRRWAEYESGEQDSDDWVPRADAT